MAVIFITQIDLNKNNSSVFIADQINTLNGVFISLWRRRLFLIYLYAIAAITFRQIKRAIGFINQLLVVRMVVIFSDANTDGDRKYFCR